MEETTLSCEDNIEMERKQIGCEGIQWIYVAQGRAQWQGL